MTEMVNGSHGVGATGEGSLDDRPEVIRRGMTMSRIFTTPGVHPYDEVTWDRRDVVQNNWKTGEVVFEQRGVEFPRLLVGHLLDHRHHQVLPRRRWFRRPRMVAASAHRPRRQDLPQRR